MNVVMVLAFTLVLCAGACQRAPDKEMEGAMGPAAAMGGEGAPIDAGGRGDRGTSPAMPPTGHGGDP